MSTSSTSDIAGKLQQVRQAGLDLGAPTEPESETGFDGRVQVFEHGRIYWHPQIGTHEVHGAILAEYLRNGGPGSEPASGARLLGFPTSDEKRTTDNIAQTSEFEFGAIFWGYGAGAVCLFGAFIRAWRSNRVLLGYPLTEPLPLPGLPDCQVVFCNFGCLFTNGADADAFPIFYEGPRLGRPEIVTPDQLGLSALTTHVLPAVVWGWIQANRPNLLSELWSDRLILQSVNSRRSQVSLAVEQVGSHAGPNGADQVIDFRLALAPGARMEDRTLYDLAVKGADGTAVVMVPHFLYAKLDWLRFGAMHATDIHVAERADFYHARLVTLGRAESVDQYNNFNECFRDTIIYVNKLHDIGLLDLIIITGDLVDYQFEEGQDRKASSGNFRYFERIVCGTVGSPIQRPIEELRVPIFTTLGNHDYRQTAYKLLFDTDIPILPDRETVQTDCHNLTEADAIALQGGKPTISSDDSLDMVRLVSPPLYYHQRINPTGSEVGANSYILRLGPKHRVVMLDSGHDLGIVESNADAFLSGFLGFGDEDKRSFIAGAPNQVGVLDSHLGLVEQALAEAADGVVVVGLHGPPLNIRGGFDDCLRETEHASADPKDIAGHLVRADPRHFIESGPPSTAPLHLPVIASNSKITSVEWNGLLARARLHAGWMDSVGQPYFMHGSVDDLLDEDASKGATDAFLAMCAGASVAGHSAPRAVDLVLCGHGHNAVEYRLAWTGSELRFFTDFYTQNPAVYYGSHKMSWDFNVKAAVRVVPGALPNPVPHNRIQDSRWDGEEWTMDVPAYADPLDQSLDVKAWWAAHRPLVIETGAVGPIEERANSRHLPGKVKPDPSFQGFRIIVVALDTIVALRYVRLEDLRAQQFALPWEKFSGAAIQFRSVWKSDQFAQVQRMPNATSALNIRSFSNRFRLQPAGNNVFWIRSLSRPGDALNIESGPLAIGPIEPGWLSARWLLEAVPGTDQFRIRNVWKSDQCLHIEAGPLQAGQIEPGMLSALWTVEAAQTTADPLILVHP